MSRQLPFYFRGNSCSSDEFACAQIYSMGARWMPLICMTPVASRQFHCTFSVFHEPLLWRKLEMLYVRCKGLFECLIALEGKSNLEGSHDGASARLRTHSQLCHTLEVLSNGITHMSKCMGTGFSQRPQAAFARVLHSLRTAPSVNLLVRTVFFLPRRLALCFP